MLLVCSVTLNLTATVSALEPGPTPLPTPWQPPTPTVAPINPPASVHLEGAIPVVVNYGEGQETRASISQGLMLPVGVPREKSVTVTLLLPPIIAGQVVKLGLYDGGRIGRVAPPGSEIISLGDLREILIPVDGTIQFNFESGSTFGLYRLLVTVGPSQYLLQFQAVRPRPAPLATPIPVGG